MSKPASMKKASMPEVGIFWIDDSDGTMFADSVSLKDSEQAGDFCDYGGSHYAMWSKVVRANPQWKGKEYEQIPRGRVVCRKDPKTPVFTVYLPKILLKFKSKILARFNIPVGYAKFDTSDEHYQV